LAGVSVRSVPPTARTHGEVAGQDADCCLSKLLSWDEGTPCVLSVRDLPWAAFAVLRGGERRHDLLREPSQLLFAAKHRE